MASRRIIGASLGNCVHVAGVQHFLAQAEDEGWTVKYLGPAVPVAALIEQVRAFDPDVVAVGYRLTPENVVPLIEKLRDMSATLARQPHWLFGGTRPVAERVREMGFFDTIYDGREDLDDCIAFLRGSEKTGAEQKTSGTLLERLAQKYPYPLLRHHFGLPTLADTVLGIEAIAQSKVLDVISLGIDQNTQQYFFHPELRDPAMDGAGGVPVANADQFRLLKRAACAGNWPLMRCYSGTADVVPFGEMLLDTIDNAWCATSLCWFNRLDGRGTRTIREGMADAQQLMRLHAQRGVPVEMNEPHHWGLRDAPDVISVAMAYISAYNAKRAGVKTYIAQYMFNVPGAMSFQMDLAKALAMAELAESLADADFTLYRQTRAGLPFMSGDLDLAKGQLAASTYLQMALKPHIIHVVGYSEAEHAATPSVIIESCKIVRGVIRSVLKGGVDQACDPVVQARKAQLISEARVLIQFIESTYAGQSSDPLCDPSVIEDAIERGILDAPHILKGGLFRGDLKTRMIDGRCVAWDSARGRELCEGERLRRLEEGDVCP
ncbi:MAG: cobalamin B12-binding domain-containing protein [Clostridia bacterium]